MGTFALDLAAYAKRTGQKVDDAVREVVKECARQVDRRSPVGNSELWAANISRAARGLPPLPKGYIGGHFRINNQYRFGIPPRNIVEGTDPTGTTALSAMVDSINASPAGGVHYVSNNVPYAEALENGHSRVQAPQGIYGLAMVDAVNAAKEIFR